MSAWIPVTERLPDRFDLDPLAGCCRDSERVLATNGRQIFVAYWRSWEEDGMGCPPSEWIIVGRDGYDFPGVTHWQPLPEPPTQ